MFDLDPVWNHLQMAMLESTEDKVSYKFSNHFEWLLGMVPTERQQIESFATKGVHIYNALSEKKFLDHYVVDTFQTETNHIRLVDNTFFPNEKYSTNIIGDYIIEFFYPDILAQYFGLFFETVKSIEQFDPQRFTDIFQMRVPCELVVRKSAKDAARYRAVIEGWFESE